MSAAVGPLRRLGLLVLLGVSATWVGAHVRLIYSGNGNPLFWSSPEAISVVINADGSDDLVDRTHLPALRNAIDAWNSVTGSQARLVEDTSSQSQSSRNWSSSQHHMMLFDEDNSSGFFPMGSGIVAITPLTFFTTGQIIDADVLFNGGGFSFTTSGELGRFDVQDVATHELGHLLGLDHSGCAGASMYPYVDPSVILHRSLSADEVRGIQSVYPVSQMGSITGTVRRAGPETIVKGAWVGARDTDGRLVAAGLSRANGTFTLSSLPSGTYTVYATPFDFPVSASNLLPGRAIETDFESAVSGPVSVTGTTSKNMGDLLVGSDVYLSLGRNTDEYPLRAITGETRSLRVRGAGLTSGSTLQSSDPSLTVTNANWFGTFVTFNLSVPDGAELGHADLIVTDPVGDVSILSAALEVSPPNPRVNFATPPSGAATGGVSVTVVGEEFRAGARVVIGDQVYVDGQPGGCTVVSSSMITLTTRASIPGPHDVTVIDASGVEGRADEGFLALAMPSVNNVFPVAGSSAGGTVLTLTGSNFVPGTSVEINGVNQPQVSVVSLTQLTVTTEGGVPGGPYLLSVTVPGGASAGSAFSYSAAPDPTLLYANPAAVSRDGGETVTLIGEGFTADMLVRVGVNPLTGSGGQSVNSTFLDATTLTFTTRARSSGKAAILVSNPLTQQAVILEEGLNVTGPPQGNVSGGCGAISVGGPPTLRGLLSGAGWVVVLVAWIGLRKRRWSPAAV